MRVSERWVWRRWQLIRVVDDGGELMLDAIELASDGIDGATGPLTLMFLDRPVPDSGGEMIGEMLRRWVDTEEGLCDVFRRRDEPFSVFAMFQGTDSVLASMHDLG